jgi:hypothetical protein
MPLRGWHLEVGIHCLLQLGVFRLSLVENRDIGIGIFPESEEILVSGLRLDRISRQSERPAELQARQCSDGIAAHDSTMIENSLEVARRFGALVCCQMGLATHIDGIERPEEPTRRAKLIWSGSLQYLDSSRTVAQVQSDARAKHWQVTESHHCIFREPLFQVSGEGLSAGRISGQGKRQRSAILHLSAI